ncbi:hypothetical protein [Burkholderia stabilis]|uniref:hypothetical protein n=1 Tax=Burkholderia stabilis TaxID=95485 RepID=UPI0015922DDA|nr:hypothetical protein [Burkholderia stabilis]
MLDLDHPMAPHILKAAEIEDRIRRRLLVWRDAPASGEAASAIAEITGQLIPLLRALNDERFGADQGIAATLDELHAAVGNGDPETSWQAFLQLAEGPGRNFGTWAI